MKPQQLHDQLEEEFHFPVDHETVLNRIGEIIVDAPDANDSDTIDEILSRDNDEIYESCDDLYESVFGNLDDDYIGRKYYDDRGSNLDVSEFESPRDDQNKSF